MAGIKLQNHFDLPNGTVVSPAGSGPSGSDAFTSVSANGLTLVYSTAQKRHGLSSALFTTTSSTSSNGAVIWGGAANGNPTAYGWRLYLYLTSLPSNQTNFLQALNTDGGSSNLLNISESGQVSCSSDLADGTHSGYTIPTGTFTPSLNTWYRFEGTVNLSTGSGGSFLMKVYAGDSTTVLATLNPTGLKNLGAAGTLQTLRYGKNTSTPTISPFYMDDLGFQDTAALMGPYTPTAPTIKATSSLSGTSLTLGGAITTFDNVAPTHAWVQTAGPTLTLSSTTAASPTATVGTAGTYSFRDTITDSLGATANSTTTFTYNGAVSAPAVSGSTATGQWVEPITATPTAAGAMSFSISPSSGVQSLQSGNSIVYYGATPSTATQYTVTATEAGNANTTQFRFTVPGAAATGGQGVRILVASNDQVLGGTFS